MICIGLLKSIGRPAVNNRARLGNQHDQYVFNPSPLERVRERSERGWGVVEKPFNPSPVERVRAAGVRCAYEFLTAWISYL